MSIKSFNEENAAKSEKFKRVSKNAKAKRHNTRQNLKEIDLDSIGEFDYTEYESFEKM